MQSLVERSADRFEKLNGIRPHIITERPPSYPHQGYLGYAKAWLWDMVPSDVERVLFMDFDVIPISPLGDIPDCEFGAALATSSLPIASDIFPFIRSSGIYFNTGVFLARRSTRPAFEQLKAFTCCKDIVMNQQEQGTFNLLIQAMCDVTVLPQSWNYQILSHSGYEAKPKLLHIVGAKSKWLLSAFILDLLETADTPAALDRVIPALQVRE